MLKILEVVEELLTGVDVVLDTVGGDTQQRSLRSEAGRDSDLQRRARARGNAKKLWHSIRLLYWDVTTARLNKLTELFDGRKLVTDVCTVLSLEDARVAHEMLADRQHRCGKIVLSVDSRSVESSNGASSK
jgi:NADPH:quinone reductase-like Zn-dependent oxidoreductase